MRYKISKSYDDIQKPTTNYKKIPHLFQKSPCLFFSAFHMFFIFVIGYGLYIKIYVNVLKCVVGNGCFLYTFYNKKKIINIDSIKIYYI